jgi:ABC-type nitrate/sulfonate/bicarbonate transport system substrate-binding protein
MTRRCNLTLTLAVASLIAVGACGGGDDGDGSGAATEPFTLMLNWTPNTHHIGIYAAEQQGWYEDEGLDVQIIEPASGGVEAAVATGEVDAGISVAEGVLPARAAGLPIVSVATILPHNDSSLMALADTGIARPRDLEGHTYGGYGGPLETELISEMVRCDGGDPTQVRFVEVGNVDYLAGMDQDRFDFVWVFSGWDALRATEVEARDISEIRFLDHLDCIPDWYTPVFIASEQAVAEDRDRLEAFLRATARGYELAMDDPEQAADLMLAAAPEVDRHLLEASARYHSTLFTDGAAWGTQEEAVWDEFEMFTRQAGLVDEAVDVRTAFTNDLLPAG